MSASRLAFLWPEPGSVAHGSSRAALGLQAHRPTHVHEIPGKQSRIDRAPSFTVS